MKKLKLLSLLLSTILFLSLTFTPESVQARQNAPSCQMEVFDCPGWFTGDRTICHENGSGAHCLCGAATMCKEFTLVLVNE